MLDVPADDPTHAAFADPKPGDEFQEMFSFWIIITRADPDNGRVDVMEFIPPCVAPDDGKVRIFATHDDFRAAYSYQTIPRYWVQLNRRGLNVTGWSS